MTNPGSDVGTANSPGLLSRRIDVNIATAIALSVVLIAAGIGVGAAIWSGSSHHGSGSGAPQVAARAPSCTRPNFIEDGFPLPPARYSANKVLDTNLRAAKIVLPVKGASAEVLAYEGTVPGPTLVVCRGDTLKIHLKNDLADETNLHTHGFHVSPALGSDNVLHHVMPGETFNYEYDLSKNDAGFHWYHPHSHGTVTAQLGKGMVGGIIELGDLDDVPGIKGVPERVMIIQGTKILAGRAVDPGDAGDTIAPATGGGDLRTASGLSAAEAAPEASGLQLSLNATDNPDIKIRPGEIQRWRILNANTNGVLKIGIDGRSLDGQSFRVIASDANTLTAPREEKTLLIGPGSRREVLVRGGALGRSNLTALALANQLDTQLATVTSGGTPVDPPQTFPTSLLPHEDLRGQPIAKSREITFSEVKLGPDGKPLPDANIQPTTVAPASSGQSLPTKIINVASTEGFPFPPNPPSPPTFYLPALNAVVSCKSKTSTALTDCTGGSGKLASGQPVVALISGFFINNQTFEEERIDQVMKLGTVERWTLRNFDESAWHTFHIHQNPFQVIDRNGVRVDYIDTEDNVSLPPRETVTVLMRFADFTGDFVFHCHFAYHEDHGMMSRVQVVP